ncbi:MAG: 16S rRNA (cytosine(1402)-N(4))-methyltransferase RsmH [Fimbriimonadales bacterium]
MRHRPAMLAEVLQLLEVQKGDIVVDGTIGHGGHAEAMAEMAGKEGELIAFDWDGEMLRTAKANLENAEIGKTFVNADYRSMPNWVSENRSKGVDRILLDFGVNLQHFEDLSRGFSFQGDAPLDMRMDRDTKETASAWLNRASEGEIARVLREFGGELWSGPIAKRIVVRRKDGRMKTTSDLVDAVFSAIPSAKRDKKIHPATRTFQAVRIAINRELENLEETVAEIAGCLAPGGRVVTLSYHSGEDAAVKNAFRNLSKEGGFMVITKKPLRPTEIETKDNPNSRSARLRALEKVR